MVESLESSIGSFCFGNVSRSALVASQRSDNPYVRSVTRSISTFQQNLISNNVKSEYNTLMRSLSRYRSSSVRNLVQNVGAQTSDVHR